MSANRVDAAWPWRLKRSLLVVALGVAAIAGALYARSEHIMLGAKGYITKPYTDAQVLETIKSVF